MWIQRPPSCALGEVPMITQSNIRSAVFRPGGAISFELLVLWFYLVLHLMKEWGGLFVGCGMGWRGGSMIFLWMHGGGWAVLSVEQMSRWPFSLLNDEQMSNKVGGWAPTRKGRVFLQFIGEEVEMEVGGCKILGILYELLRKHLPPESHESVAMTPQLGVVS